ncbi:MAG: AMP-binding protein [Betaproteobacteria bacterium]
MRYLWKLHEEFERAQRKTAPPLAGDTAQAMFWNAVALRSDQVWLRYKQFGIWQSLTWQQTADQVEAITAGLIALGLAVQDRVAIISNTRAEWVLADLATLSAAAATVGVYPTDSPQQLSYVINDSSARFIFVEDEEQLDKALSVMGECPSLGHVIVMDEKGLSNYQHERVLGWSALLALGRRALGVAPGMVKERLAQQRTDHLAMLVYSSGTTGNPK